MRRIRTKRHVMLDLATREAIVIARFGSLVPGRPAICSIRDIGVYFHVPYSTVRKTIDNFKQHGRVIKKKRGRHNKEIPENVARMLSSPWLL